MIVCRNLQLADERAHEREELLQATEQDLEPIRKATLRRINQLRGEKEIGLRVSKVIRNHKTQNHFELTTTNPSYTFVCKKKKIKTESILDGEYVVRTNVDVDTINPDRVVETYKSLSYVERAFRCLKTVDFHLRPMYHCKGGRIRAHVFVCMLACYVEWHMRERLREVLFDDGERKSGQPSRSSIVAPSVRSETAKRMDATRRTESGYLV